MSLHLQKFVDRVRGQEARGAKDLVMSMADAKDLHADITRLLIDLQNLRENAMLKDAVDEVITVQMDGGSFK
jgi:hypothetical protein